MICFLTQYSDFLVCISIPVKKMLSLWLMRNPLNPSFQRFICCDIWGRRALHSAEFLRIGVFREGTCWYARKTCSDHQCKGIEWSKSFDWNTSVRETFIHHVHFALYFILLRSALSLLVAKLFLPSKSCFSQVWITVLTFCQNLLSTFLSIG